MKWRNRGWLVFEAIERETRADSGYVYLYLLFKEDDLMPLDRWVFNIEAHPVPGLYSNGQRKRDNDFI